MCGHKGSWLRESCSLSLSSAVFSCHTSPYQSCSHCHGNQAGKKLNILGQILYAVTHRSSGKSFVFLSKKWLFQVLGDTHCFCPINSQEKFKTIKINETLSFLTAFQIIPFMYLWEVLKQARQTLNPKEFRALD
jgi:hypothetical protein